MTRIWSAAAVLVAWVVAHGGIESVAIGAKPRTIGLRVTMADGPYDRIRGSQGPTYTNGVGGVVAFENGSGLQFQPGSRGLTHEFTVCVDEPCHSPYATGTGVTVVNIHPLTADGSASAAGGLLGLPLNEERKAFLKILLSTQAESAFWTICSDTRTEVAGICAASHSSTGARVTRTGAGTWIVSARADAAGGRSDIADLIKEAGSGRRSIITTEGTYSMPFTMTVECLVAADCPAP